MINGAIHVFNECSGTGPCDGLNNFWRSLSNVFLGDNGAPATSFGPGTQQYTTLPSAPVSEEKPFLYTDSDGRYHVFVPAVQHNSVGPDYASGLAAGSSIPIRRFFTANPSTPLFEINAALAVGQNLILTPGVYNLHGTIEVTRPDTVVLGLGFPTLIPQDGNVSMRTARVPGIKLSGIIFDAGPQNSPALLELGSCRADRGSDRARGRQARNGEGEGCRPERRTEDSSDPTLVQDVFFRIGGAEVGQATDSLIVTPTTRSSMTSGRGGPTTKPAPAGPATAPTPAAFLVSPRVTSFQGYGMGSYSFFNQGVPIFATQAFQSPNTPGVQFHDIFTLFLNASGGSGGINSVINGVGGSSTAANPDTPVTWPATRNLRAAHADHFGGAGGARPGAGWLRAAGAAGLPGDRRAAW